MGSGQLPAAFATRLVLAGRSYSPSADVGEGQAPLKIARSSGVAIAKSLQLRFFSELTGAYSFTFKF